MLATVGSEGTFVEWANGFSAGIPDAHAPADHAAPFSLTGETHNQRVVAYFKACGLPEAQIGEIQISAAMQQTGTLERKNAPQLIGYTTTLGRQAAGVRVAGSYAWASFNANDDVVAERVWWPELPKRLSDEAAAFAQSMRVTSSSGAYRASLPADVAAEVGEVVIWHSPPFWKSWTARTLWEVRAKGDASSRTFDLDGREVDLASGT